MSVDSEIRVEFTDADGRIYFVKITGDLGGLIRLIAILASFLYSSNWHFNSEALSSGVMWHFENEKSGALVSIKIPWEVYEFYKLEENKLIVRRELGVSFT